MKRKITLSVLLAFGFLCSFAQRNTLRQAGMQTHARGIVNSDNQLVSINDDNQEMGMQLNSFDHMLMQANPSAEIILNNKRLVPKDMCQAINSSLSPIVYYVTGMVQDLVTQNPSLPNRMFIAALDGNGNTLWYKDNAGANPSILFEMGVSLVPLSNGGVVVIGNQFGSPTNVIAARYNQNGTEIWSYDYSTSLSGNKLIVKDACLNPSDNTIGITGYVSNFSGSDQHTLAMNIDLNGNKLWEFSYTNSSATQMSNGNSIIPMSGGYLIAGTSFQTTFSPHKIYLLNLKSNGKILSSKQLEIPSGYNSWLAQDIQFSEKANVYLLTGLISHQANLTAINTTFAMKLNYSGNSYDWAMDYPNTLANATEFQSTISLISASAGNKTKYFITTHRSISINTQNDIQALVCNTSGHLNNGDCCDDGISLNTTFTNLTEYMNEEPIIQANHGLYNWDYPNAPEDQVYTFDYCPKNYKVYLEHISDQTNLMSTYYTDNYSNVGFPLSMPDPNKHPFSASSAPIETVSPSVFSTTENNAIVDWIKVELRDENDIHLVHEARFGLLQADGDIVTTDGTCPLKFSDEFTNQKNRIAIFHRNHLAICTDQAVNVNQTYNFTDNSVPLYYQAKTKAKGNYQVMITGDASDGFNSTPGNSDGIVNANDENYYFLINGLFDNYDNNADFDFDGDVSGADSIYFGSNLATFDSIHP